MTKSKRQKKPVRVPIKQESRIRAELQKEIGSRCPFCSSEDVGHFEIHHIDEDRTNNEIYNLLLICKSCHSKFTKYEWPLIKAREKKDELLRDINYLLFQSDSDYSFDYICYDMQSQNGRIPEDNGNGSTANVLVKDRYHFIVTLKQIDGRIWKGELILEQKDFGRLLFRYEGDLEFEFGQRECYLKQIETTEFRDDILFFKPLTDLKDYGNEFMRKRTPKI
jgi:hypothetical protein